MGELSMSPKEQWKRKYRIQRIAKNSLENLLKAIEAKGFTYTLSVA